MIEYVIGDATDPQGDGHKLIVHCCNDAGAWGAGFVLALSKRWSLPEYWYRNLGKRDGYELGAVQYVAVSDDITVINLIGQQGIRKNEFGIPPVRYDAIYAGLKEIAQVRTKDSSVHMPRMGAGLAGGSWRIIESIIEETLCKTGIPVTVYDLASA